MLFEMKHTSAYVLCKIQLLYKSTYPHLYPRLPAIIITLVLLFSRDVLCLHKYVCMHMHSFLPGIVLVLHRLIAEWILCLSRNIFWVHALCSILGDQDKLVMTQLENVCIHKIHIWICVFWYAMDTFSHQNSCSDSYLITKYAMIYSDPPSSWTFGMFCMSISGLLETCCPNLFTHMARLAKTDAFCLL